MKLQHGSISERLILEIVPFLLDSTFVACLRGVLTPREIVFAEW